MSGVNYPYRYQYETVAASQTAQVLGGTGATGDYIDRLIITVNTAATAAVTLLDGATSIAVMPNSPGGGIGVYSIPIMAVSNTGPWKVTTGAGSTVIAVGIFSA